MKRRLVTFIVALICALACAIGLSACTGGNNGGGSGGDPTMTGLVIVTEDGNETSYYEMGEYVYYQKPDFSSLSLYVKYSDGTKEQIYGDSDGVTTTYNLNGDEVEATSSFGLGSWVINMSYNSYSAVIHFDIVTSATATPFRLNLTNITWSFLEEPEVTVYESVGITTVPVDEERYSLYYVEKDVYDEIKGAEDFRDKLRDSMHILTYNTKPGSYYMFAYVSTGHGSYNSDFRSITIRKAKLNAEMMDDSTDFRAYYYYNGDVLGDIKLSDITVWGPFFKSADGGGAIWGTWQFVNGETAVNSTNDGHSYSVKYVPEEYEADYYEEFTLLQKVKIEIEKGSVRQPAIYGAYSVNYYDGTEQEVKMNYYDNGMLERYQKLVTVKRGNKELEFTEGGLLGTHKEIGEYLYTFALKDTTNYYWYNDSDYTDTTDSSQKALWYNILPITSYMSLYNDDGYLMDGNCKARIKIDPGVNVYGEDAVYNASPYKAGTLQVQFLSSYLGENDYEQNRIYSDISATVAVENDGEYDYIVITVTGIKAEDYYYHSGATVVLRVTAEGDEHYDDIEYVSAGYVKILLCELKASQRIEVPVGTTIADLYEMYPTLNTALGKWEFYVWAENEQGQFGFIKLEDSAEIDERTRNYTIMFAPTDKECQTDFHNIGIIIVVVEQA